MTLREQILRHHSAAICGDDITYNFVHNQNNRVSLVTLSFFESAVELIVRSLNLSYEKEKDTVTKVCGINDVISYLESKTCN